MNSGMDWIEQRIRCSGEHAWTALRERLRADIERWKELTKPGLGAVQLTTEQERMTITAGDRWVDLTRKRDHVSVRRPKTGTAATPDDVETLRLIPVLTADGECRLRWNGNEIEFWQASRELLEPVLFAD